jgi:hypothetical protein
MQVEYTNPDTGVKETDNLRNLLNKKEYRQARDAVELPYGMDATKNFYENRLIRELVAEEVQHNKVQYLVDEYMQMRLKGCMINKHFAQAMDSDNAHLYLKALRENVVVELGLNRDAKTSQLSAQELSENYWNHNQYADPENRYNMLSVNNEHAVGFDNIQKRGAADTAQQNYEAAHETVFEKMMADYFLEKRGEYK